MKRNFFLMFFIIHAFVAHAQFSFGVTGGINISSVLPLNNYISTAVGDPADNINGDQNLTYNQNKAINRAYGGIIVKHNLSKVLRLRTGVMYTEKGWFSHSYNNNILESNISDTRYKINFLELPVDIEYGTTVGPGRAFIGLGPFISYAINGKYSNYAGWLPGSGNYNLYPTHSITYEGDYFSSGTKRIEYGFNALIGYEFGFGVFLTASYELSLKGVIDSEPKQNFSVFQLGAGFMFSNIRNKKK